MNDINYLYKLYPNFKSLKENIDNDICFNIDTQKFFIGEIKCKNRVIKGFMQSKKTWAIITSSIYYTLHGIQTVIVVENKLSSIEQITTRFQHVFSIYHLDFKIMRGKDWKGEKNSILLCLRNERDLLCLKIKNYVVFLDESDALDNLSFSSAQNQINIVKERAKIVWNVSATAISTLMIDQISSEEIYLLEKPKGYKDILSFNMIRLDKDIQFSEIKNPIKADPNLRDYLFEFQNRKPYDYHPVVSLVKISNIVYPQIVLAKYITKKYGNKVVVITFNGSSYGTTLRGSMFSDKITINGKDYKRKKGVFYLDIHIGDLLTFLQTDSNTYSHICIISGKMADRGISFCSNMPENSWHLTEMYYIPSKTTEQANLLQATGRLCGVFNDDIVPTLYSNACDDILKAYLIQEELLFRTKEKQGVAKEIIPELPINKSKCSKRRITATKVICKLNKVNSDSDSGGWNWNEKFNRDLDIGKSKKCTQDINIILKLYLQKDSMIHKIIKVFENQGFIELSKDFIKKQVQNDKLNLTNYDRWGAHWKYHVLDKVRKDFYKIRPDVVKLLGL